MKSLFRKKPIAKILSDAQAGYGDGEHGSLHKVLGVKDLTFFGIAAVIGAGIFTSIGKACYDGGPGVIFLYIFTAIACGFAALCYAEFASTVPVSGSAYTYAYVAFGEIFAWIIGWDLLMEYAIGNIAVAISWSDYFTHLLDGAGWYIPRWLTMDYHTAHTALLDLGAMKSQLQSWETIPQTLQISYIENASTLIHIPSTDIQHTISIYLEKMHLNTLADFFDKEKIEAWTKAPSVGSLKLILDLPAFAIVALITYIIFIGIKESRGLSNMLVIIKLAVIFFVIVLGAYYVNPENWTPFAPNGIKGILKGVSAVFFAYIGFDAISTTAEECKNPQRDLPRAMIYALLICTVLYVLLALILTGMVPYTALNVGDPLAAIFEARGLKIIAGIVAVSAIVATASVLLVFQLGQPRIWMSMSRDGLLPAIFSRIHPRYKTPSFSTILTGFLVAIPALFLNLDVVISLTSIGTLFAFVLVCAGVIVLQNMPDKPASKFSVPYINARWVLLTLFTTTLILIFKYYPQYWHELIDITQFPMICFWFMCIAIVAISFTKTISLIPVLGLISCFYLMAQESHTNWLRFAIWLILGLCVYFLYSKRKSKLNGYE